MKFTAELGLKYVCFEKKKRRLFLSDQMFAEDLRSSGSKLKESEMNIKYSSVARRVRWKLAMKEKCR